MGQLLTLATHCINDKKFYISNSSRLSIRNSFSGYYNSTIYEKIYTINNDSIKPKSGNEWLILNALVNKIKATLKLLPSSLSLQITFEDEPDLLITKKLVTTDFKKEIGSVVITEKSFKFFKKDVRYDFQYSITTQKYEHMIICGSITEVITEEEFTGLNEAYIANTTKLKQEADQDKINLRLKEYDNEEK